MKVMDRLSRCGGRWDDGNGGPERGQMKTGPLVRKRRRSWSKYCESTGGWSSHCGPPNLKKRISTSTTFTYFSGTGSESHVDWRSRSHIIRSNLYRRAVFSLLFCEWSVRLLRLKWAGCREGARDRRLGATFFGSSRNPILDLLRCSCLSRWGRWVGRGRGYQVRRSIFDRESLLGDEGDDMPQDSLSPSLLVFL